MVKKKKIISVLIVDDHPLFRQGVIDVISSSDLIRVVGEASDGEKGMELIRSDFPDVAIVDINLPGINGQQIARQVDQEKISTKTILLTAFDDKEQMLHSAWAGASGYCAKDIEPYKLIQAIIEIDHGNYVMGDQVLTKPEFSQWLDEQMGEARHLFSDPGSPFHPLSLREMDVLKRVVEGMSNKEIASVLGISQQTVKNHITSILRKFGVEDRTQAVVYALKRGWIHLNNGEESGDQE